MDELIGQKHYASGGSASLDCWRHTSVLKCVQLRVVNWTSVIRWPVIKPIIGLQMQ